MTVVPPGLPSVTVVIPTYNEEPYIEATLDSIALQTYGNIVEVLVVDGRSTDATRAVVEQRGDARLIDNPARIQAAALNVAIADAAGEVIVRVDGHCLLAPDYVERCVSALVETGAAMVGGGMTPVAEGWRHGGIARAMSSGAGAGPARFHIGGPSGWVDTVYLGAYWVERAREVGGYRSDMAANEDAEFAHRMRSHGGVWFDATIRSTYVPRSTYRALAEQFWRYGVARSMTVRLHPGSLAPRQLSAPLLVLGLVSPFRRWVALAYATFVAVATVRVMQRGKPSEGPGFALALPVMHITWGLGFLAGITRLVRATGPVDGARVERECEGDRPGTRD